MNQEQLREATIESIESKLADFGYRNPKLVSELLETVEGLSELKLAGHLDKVVSRLPETPGAECVVRFLLEDPEPIRAAARRIGCSDSSLLRAERRFRRFIGAK